MSDLPMENQPVIVHVTTPRSLPQLLNLPAGTTVAEVLHSLDLASQDVFASCNGTIVTEGHVLQNGDMLIARPVKVLPVIKSPAAGSKECDRCGAPAVFMDRFCGPDGREYAYALCKSHFLQALSQRVHRLIHWFRLIKPNDLILVPLSGEKDSSLVLYLLTQYHRQHSDFQIVAYTIDEGIEGYSNHRTACARQVANNLGVPHIVTTFQEEFGLSLDEMVARLSVGDTLQYTPCEICNALLMKSMARVVKQVNPTKIAGSRNMDEKLLYFLRGLIFGDARGLPGMPARMYDPCLEREGIHLLAEVRAKEVAIAAFLLDLPVSCHWSNQCPYFPDGGIGMISKSKFEEAVPGIGYMLVASYHRLWKKALPEHLASPRTRSCMTCQLPFIVSETSTCTQCKACNILTSLQLPCKGGFSETVRAISERQRGNDRGTQQGMVGTKVRKRQFIIAHPGMRWWKGADGKYLLFDPVNVRTRYVPRLLIRFLELADGEHGLEEIIKVLTGGSPDTEDLKEYISKWVKHYLGLGLFKTLEEAQQ